MKQSLIEGVDFNYTEKEGLRFKVFTEHYLLKRGFCCKNNCQNCPYGFKNKNKNSLMEFKKIVEEQFPELKKYIVHSTRKKILLEDSNTAYSWGKNTDLDCLNSDLLKSLISNVGVSFCEKENTFSIVLDLK